MTANVDPPMMALPSRPQWLIGLAYVSVFVLLDWASYIRPLQGLNITPWNPQPALAIALLFRNRRLLWLVWLSLMAAELLVRGVPSDWLAPLMATAALSLAYGVIAHALAIRLDRRLALATLRDLVYFTGIVVIGSMFSGMVYVTAFAAAGRGPTGPLHEAIARYWIGDAVGLLVSLPILLVMIDPVRRAALAASLKSLRWWAIALLTVLLLWFVFGQGEENHFKFFYLLLLPVIWASAALGVLGAILAAGLTQLGLIVAVQSLSHQDLTVFELQVLMAAITLTGLLLGAAVDERARAAAELRSSLRLAAAGQMAAALAHELSQPLTALSSYAQACRLLVATPNALSQDRLDQLAEVCQKMIEDARRAAEVVKRLRNFFRSGSIQLEPVSPATVIREAVEAHGRRAVALHVRIDHELQENTPAALMDPVQIAVVLRNLIANAIEAASDAAPAGRVLVSLRVEGGEFRFDVLDNGRGVSAAHLQTLFDGGPSDKPGGMGIGLSICRAIVEAHGGRLWAESGSGGRFCFTLPLEPQSPVRAADAP